MLDMSTNIYQKKWLWYKMLYFINQNSFESELVKIKVGQVSGLVVNKKIT